MQLKYWATRDKNTSEDNYIKIYSDFPNVWKDGDDIEYFLLVGVVDLYFLRQKISTFKKNFGFILEKGECKKVVMEFTLIRKK